VPGRATHAAAAASEPCSATAASNSSAWCARDRQPLFTTMSTPSVSASAVAARSASRSRASRRAMPGSTSDDRPRRSSARTEGSWVAADLAGDGDTALELLGTHSYDIAVLDRDVPGPSGDDVAAHTVASGSGLPILVHNQAGGWARVTASTSAAGGVLTVENTGAPLDPALVATLAEPFRRGAQRLHDDHGGVGLGLAIVRRITAAHGGTLARAPRPGGGLVVTVALARRR
jgi:two-component system sensor histidine kinase VanS